MPTKKKATTKKAPIKKSVKKAVAKKVAPACVCTESCKPGESFWVNYGPIVDSMAALREAIQGMSDEQFRYHTTRGTNDFASWIRHCFGAEAVASRVEKATTRVAAVKVLSACCR